MRYVAVCPKDASHVRFLATAYVSEDWIVEPDGQWIETADPQGPAEVLYEPNIEDTWTCAECGAIANHEEIAWS